jgi:hypothetical protein
MKRPTFEFPEAKGKTIEEVLIFDDPENGREILLRFTDETVLSVVLETSTVVTGKLYCNEGGSMQKLCERGDAVLPVMSVVHGD